MCIRDRYSVAMGQIPRSTERISGMSINLTTFLCNVAVKIVIQNLEQNMAVSQVFFVSCNLTLML